ncbi:MAG: DNA translocase FtsK [Lachnospiraceae bacterium]|nr:DNA translocase FtsK [Lachnospiraceae bacterium]
MAGTASKTRKKRSTNQKKANNGSGGLFDEVLILLVLAVSVLLLLSAFKLLGTFGSVVSSVMFGLFGLGAYLVPFAIFFLFVFYISNRGNPVVSVRIYASVAGVIIVCALIHMFTMKNADIKVVDYYELCSSERDGGGVLGAAIGLFLTNTIGKIGAYIVLFVLLLIAGVLITERSIISGLKKGSRTIAQRHMDNARKYREYKESLEEEYQRGEKEREKERGQREAEQYDRSRLREERNRERQERIREKENEREIRRRERRIKREEEFEKKRLELEEREQAVEEKRKRRSEMKVSGVIFDTKIRDDNEINDDIHEVKFDPDDEGYKALSFKNDHRIVVDRDFGIADTESDPEDEIFGIGRDRTKDNGPVILGVDEVDDIILPPEDTPQKDQGTDRLRTQEKKQDTVIKEKTKKPVAIPAGKKEEAYEAFIPGTDPDGNYTIPPVELLDLPKNTGDGDSMETLRATSKRLQETLATFGVNVEMTQISKGPTVTRFEMVPQTGVKVSKILGLSDDIKLNMAAMDVRIEAPIPGKAAIGIEIPNQEATPVHFRELIEDENYKKAASKITFAVGKDIEGKVIVTDIAKMPHLLIAGATGSGKSVCINTLIMSILYKADPEEVKLIMIDPKVVELSVYNGIPHLMIPVVTDPRKAAAALQWGVAEMTDRYNKFAEYGVRDMKGYNKRIENDFKDVPKEERPAKMPQIVIIVDELADLMMVASKEVEESICRIAQLARAAGIHLVIATQRPSVDVITGLIKANMPSRIAFSVSSGVDSRTILDMVGAEKLLGKGDMLFYPQGYSKPARLQGAFVTDDEVTRVVDYIKNQGEVEYDPEVISKLDTVSSQGSSSDQQPGLSEEGGRDALFEQAARLIIEKDKASIGMLQRMFKIGFNRAARIMDQLADAGVVGEEQGTKPREILMGMEQFEQYVEEYL